MSLWWLERRFWNKDANDFLAVTNLVTSQEVANVRSHHYLFDVILCTDCTVRCTLGIKTHLE